MKKTITILGMAALAAVSFVTATACDPVCPPGTHYSVTITPLSTLTFCAPD